MSTFLKCGRPQANFKENVWPQLINEFYSRRIKHGELANQVHLEVIFTYSTALRHAACLAFQFTVPVTACDACAGNGAWTPSSDLTCRRCYILQVCMWRESSKKNAMAALQVNSTSADHSCINSAGLVFEPLACYP